MGLKAVFFDLDDTLYTSFQAGDAYAYEKLEEWAISTFGDKGKGFADAFRVNRKRLARQQPAMPPTHDRVLFAQGANSTRSCVGGMTVCCLHPVHGPERRSLFARGIPRVLECGVR